MTWEPGTRNPKLPLEPNPKGKSRILQPSQSFGSPDVAVKSQRIPGQNEPGHRQLFSQIETNFATQGAAPDPVGGSCLAGHAGIELRKKDPGIRERDEADQVVEAVGSRRKLNSLPILLPEMNDQVRFVCVLINDDLHIVSVERGQGLRALGQEVLEGA